jgi:hypothetical protein
MFMATLSGDVPGIVQQAQAAPKRSRCRFGWFQRRLRIAFFMPPDDGGPGICGCFAETE